MENSTSIATARRNLAQRIERFLAVKRESVLTAGEATNIAGALSGRESGRYPDGEDAMMLAEKDWPPRGELGTAVPIKVLAERLAAVLQPVLAGQAGFAALRQPALVLSIHGLIFTTRRTAAHCLTARGGWIIR